VVGTDENLKLTEVMAMSRLICTGSGTALLQIRVTGSHGRWVKIKLMFLSPQDLLYTGQPKPHCLQCDTVRCAIRSPLSEGQ